MPRLIVPDGPDHVAGGRSAAGAGTGGSNGATTGHEAELWRMADTLRGSMDAAEYKHVVLGLIFLKYISDAFEEQHARLEGERAAGADPEDPDEYRAENIFWVPVESRWGRLQAQARQAAIGRLVDDAMAGIERDNAALKEVLPKDYARPGLNRHDLHQATIRYPTRVADQRAIGHVLGVLDDKIELNRRMNDTLEAMVRALFKSWFIDFDPVRAKQEGRDTGLPNHLSALFPDRLVESAIGDVPEEWEVLPLPELIEVNPKRTLRRGQAAPYLDMANMPTNGHSPDTVIERPFGSGTRFINGDTLVARITPCLENGKTAYVDFLDGGVTGWGSTEYIVMRPKPPLPNVFAYCLARSSRFREFLIRNMSGTSGRQRVSPQVLSQFLLPVPSERCAVAFGEAVRPFVARARDAALESDQLAAIRDILLPALISGALRGDRREAFSEAMV